MGLDDAVTDRQTEPRALSNGLRREKWLKELGLVFLWHAWSAVLHFEARAGVDVEGSDHDAAAGDPIRRKRLLGIDHEVEHDLLQLGEDRQNNRPGAIVHIAVDAAFFEFP